ncbi:unnamed protein product, partial [marine sediment metagenome]
MDITNTCLGINEHPAVLGWEYHNIAEIRKFQDSYPRTWIGRDGNFLLSWRAGHHISGIEVLKKEKKTGNALYIACAFGIGVKLMEYLGYDVKGIDIKPFYVKSCIKRGLDVSLDDAFDLQFPDDTFDITISRDFLRRDYIHENGIEFSLNEQHRVLKPGGIAINYSHLDWKSQ